jgi:hypothetical protein
MLFISTYCLKVDVNAKRYGESVELQGWERIEWYSQVSVQYLKAT